MALVTCDWQCPSQSFCCPTYVCGTATQLHDQLHAMHVHAACTAAHPAEAPPVRAKCSPGPQLVGEPAEGMSLHMKVMGLKCLSANPAGDTHRAPFDTIMRFLKKCAYHTTMQGLAFAYGVSRAASTVMTHTKESAKCSLNERKF